MAMATKEPAEVPQEFGKGLSACIVCRLIKTFEQFYTSGCENCDDFLRLEGDQDRCSECTTPHFQGMLTIMDPQASWTAKWTHSRHFVPGVYALSIQEKVPEHIEEILVDNKIAWHRRPN